MARSLIINWEVITFKHLYQLQFMGNCYENIFIISRDYFGHGSEVTSNLHNCHLITGSNFKRFFKYIRIVLAEDCHQIISPYGISPFFYILVSKFFKRQWSLIEWGPIDFFDRKNLLEKFLVRTMFSWSDLVIYKEPYQYRKVQQHGFAGKGFFMPNAVEFCESCFDPMNRYNLLWVNRFSENRYHDFLISYVGEDISFRSKYRVTMLGDWLGEYSDKTIEGLDIFGYESPVSFYEGHSFFIFLADRIFGNNALYESMSRGLIPIVLNSESLDLVIRDGVNGFVIDRLSKENLTATFRRIEKIKDLELREISENARQSVLTHFSVEGWGVRFGNLIASG